MVCMDWIHLAFVSTMWKKKTYPRLCKRVNKRCGDGDHRWRREPRWGHHTSMRGEGASRQDAWTFTWKSYRWERGPAPRWWPCTSVSEHTARLWAGSGRQRCKDMENGQEMEGEQGWRGRHPHTAARKGQCMKGLVPQQMANAGGVRFEFFLKKLKQKQREQKPIRK